MELKGIRERQAGFSLLEMTVVVFMSIIITAIAVPEYLSAIKYLRIAGDLRVLNALTAQAKMRAAANFTHARVFADLTDNSVQLQVWNKTGGAGGTGCWEADLQPGTCLTWTSAPAPSGPTVSLSQKDSFGFGTVTTGPTPGTTTVAQSPNCYKEGATGPDTGAQMANTACIEFNSRGIPVDNTNAPLATGALYITNTQVVNAVTVSATGSIQAWLTPAGQNSWHAQ